MSAVSRLRCRCKPCHRSPPFVPSDLDLYVRVALALRAALVDDTIAGWQLNAANGRGPPKGTAFWSGTQAFLAREAAEHEAGQPYLTSFHNEWRTDENAAKI